MAEEKKEENKPVKEETKEEVKEDKPVKTDKEDTSNLQTDKESKPTASDKPSSKGDKLKDTKTEKEEKPASEKTPKSSDVTYIKKDEKKPEIKKIKKERIGILNIYTTFNNTIMNLTDMSGKSLAKYSGGQSTKQDR